MKNLKIKDVLLYVMLILICIFPGLVKSFRTEHTVFALFFLIDSAILAFVKNIKLKSIAVALITAGVSIYRYEYLILYVPVMCLMVMYCGLYDNNKNADKIIETCNTVYSAAAVFKIFYIVFLSTKATRQITYIWRSYTTVVATLVIFFLVLLVTNSKTITKDKKKKLSKFKMFYINSLVGIIEDMFIFILSNTDGDTEMTRFYFMHWISLVLLIIFFKSPETELLISKFNSGLGSFLNSERQSK